MNANVLAAQNWLTDHPYQRDPEDRHRPSTMTESGTVQMQRVVCPVHRHGTAEYLCNTITESTIHFLKKTQQLECVHGCFTPVLPIFTVRHVMQCNLSVHQMRVL